MILIESKELDVRIPDKIIFTDNGAYDLEREGITGYYTWIGYEHSASGAPSKALEKVLEKYVYEEVVPAFKNLFGVGENMIIVDNKLDSSDMFRVWISIYEK